MKRKSRKKNLKIKINKFFLYVILNHSFILIKLYNFNLFYIIFFIIKSNIKYHFP